MNSNDAIYKICFDSPIGPLTMGSEPKGLVFVRVGSGDETRPDPEGMLLAGRTQLEEFFRGERREFTLPLRPRGTEFQLKVWRQLMAVPYGNTSTYGQIAAGIGQPGASRAVGSACGKNPLLIFIPCHRVVAASGLGGFSAGLHIKEAILAMERIKTC